MIPIGPSAANPSARPELNGEAAAQMGWLHKEIDQQLEAYRGRRRRDKRKSFALQMATVFFSATITVLLGLRVSGQAQKVLADTALAFGALITVLAAAEAFFSHRGLWLLRTETVRRLENLARQLQYYDVGLMGSQPDVASVDHYHAELERILASDHGAWQRLRQTATDKASDVVGPSGDWSEKKD
jgi:hypothetical protein